LTVPRPYVRTDTSDGTDSRWFSPETQINIWGQVSEFDSFTEDNDPHGEHDFGAFDVEDVGKIFWKIDYYADKTCESGSVNPSDTAQCFRVLTIMLAEEY
jgi:hypothetical protein